MAEVSENSGLVSFGGLASNLDTNKIVEALVESQRQPMKKIEQRQTILDAHDALIQSVSDRLTTLTQTLRSMESFHRLMSPRVDSSNPAVVTAVAVEGALAGVHFVQVDALATSQRVLSAPIARRDDPQLLGRGAIRWRFDDADQQVEVDGEKTLDELAFEINQLQAGVSSSVLFDGQNFRLSVRGLKQGAGSELNFQDDSQLQLGDPARQIQAAQDARFVLDEAIVMTRPTNTISDVVEGITLRLIAPGPMAAVAVTTDAAKLSDTVNAFVEQYNEVRQSIDAAIRPNGNTLEKQRMVGDSSLRNLQDMLQRAVTGGVAGGRGGSSTLGAIGISSSKEGTLKVDAARLDAAIDQDPGAVARLFSRDRVAGTKGMAGGLLTICDQYAAPVTGVLTMRTQSLHRERTTHDNRLAQMQSNLDRYEQGQRKKFAELERTMTAMKSQNEKLQAQMKSLQK